MNTWTSEDAAALSAPQEVHVVTRREDGSLREPRIIWAVRVADQIFIRSTNGRGADWYRWAVATGNGQLITGRRTADVVFVEADESDLPRVDAAYRAKYTSYASIVDHLVGPEPRAATLEVRPA